MTKKYRENFVPMVPFMPENPQVTNAYVPYQLDIDELPLARALACGTLFTVLLSPYDGRLDGREPVC